MNKKDSLGDRMKRYEYVTRNFLTRKLPVIIRLDGKAFHTFTRGLDKPFDSIFVEAMQNTAKYLCENVQNCVLGYTQSDEITLVLVDYKELETDSWFGSNIQKMVSVSASMATLAFNKEFERLVLLYGWEAYEEDQEKRYSILDSKIQTALFDSRVFTVPKEDVTNCVLWRQQDATRNSIQSVGQYHFSDKQLFKKSTKDIIRMLQEEKDILWNELPAYLKRGTAVIKDEYGKWVLDLNMPILTEDREYVEKLINF